MFTALRKLFQQVVAPPRSNAQPESRAVEPLSSVIEFSVPALKADNGDAISRNQKKYLDDLKIPGCENLSLTQAALVIGCVEYVRLLYADNFDCNSNLCPSVLYLNMLPFMLSHLDICDYALKWNEGISMRESAIIRPFARRRDNPIHVAIQQKFTELNARI